MREIIIDDRVHVCRDALFASDCAQRYVLQCDDVCESLAGNVSILIVRKKKRTIIKIANRRFRHCFETTTTETEGSSELHLIYTHKLSYGTGITDHYGIALAEVSSLPRCVTAKAREYASLQSIVSSIRAANVQIFISMQ